MEFGTGVVKVTPGARLQRLPDGAPAQPADDLHLRRRRAHQRGGRAVRRAGPLRGAQEGPRGSDGAGAAGEGGAAQALRRPVPALRHGGGAAAVPAVVREDRAAGRSRPSRRWSRAARSSSPSPGRTPTSTGCGTSTTGASAASCGGATRSPRTTAQCSPRVGDDTDLPRTRPRCAWAAWTSTAPSPSSRASSPRTARSAAAPTSTQDPDVLDTWFSSGALAVLHAGLAGADARAEDLLPDLRDGDRPRHHLLLGRPDDDDGPALHGGCALPHRVPARDGARREGREDVEDEGERRSIPSTSSAARRRRTCRRSLRNKFPQGMPAFGADALRFTLASLTQQGRDIKLSLDRVGGLQGVLQQAVERLAASR